MADAKRAKVADRKLDIILPGTWANVPLESEKVARAFVKQLVRKRVGTDDRLAKVRADMTDEVMKNVSAAVAVGVHTYLMSLELLPGVPFPAAILMADEPWPDTARPGLGDGDVPRALREGFPGGMVLDQRSGPVLRIAEFADTRLVETPVKVLRLEYHVPYPDLTGLLYARISVPNLPAAEPFTTLFDEIIDSLSFLQPGPDAGVVPAG